MSPCDIITYTHKISHTWLLKCELSKDNNRPANMDRRKTTRPQLYPKWAGETVSFREKHTNWLSKTNVLKLIFLLKENYLWRISMLKLPVITTEGFTWSMGKNNVTSREKGGNSRWRESRAIIWNQGKRQFQFLAFYDFYFYTTIIVRLH